MINPYSPPKSQLVAESKKRYPGVLWKVFFWINMALVPLFILGVMLSPSLSILDYIDIILFFVFVAGMYGFAFQKKLVQVDFWKVVTILYPLWFVVYELVLPFGFGVYQYGEEASFGGTTIFAVVYSLLIQLTLYKYTYSSRELWEAS